MSALGALLAASPAAARSDGPTLPEGTIGAVGGQAFQSSAVDATGDAVIVWASTDGDGNYFEDAAVRPAGGEMETPSQLSPNAFTKEGVMPGEIESPPAESAVAFGPDGEVVALWTRQTAEGQQLEAATLPSIGGHWTSAEPLTRTDEQADNPSVSIGPEGTALAVWDSGSQKVEAAELPAGGSWADLGQLSRPTTAEHAFGPLVKFDSQGDAVVTWTDADPTVAAQRVAVDYRPEGEAFEGPVTPWADANEIGDKDFAFDKAGDLTLVWENEPDGSSGETEALAAELPAGGSWSAAETLGHEDARDPRVAVTPSGYAVAVWQTANGVANVEYKVRSFPGVPFNTTPTALTSFTNSGEGAGDPEVTLGEEGTAFVTWHAYTAADGRREEGSMRSSSGVWESIGQISETGSEEPSLSGNVAGESLESWVYDGELETLVFDAAAPRFASLVVPAEGTVGVPVYFEAETRDMTRVGVGWDAGNGEEAGGPIAGFEYTAPGTYTVTATAEDQLGNIAEETREITIKAATPSIGGETNNTGGSTTTTTSTSTTTTSAPATTTKSTTTREWLALAKVERDHTVGDGALVLKAPGKGTITVSGPGVKTTTVKTKGKGTKVKLVLTPKGSFAKRLAGGHHRGWTTVTIVYTPANGDAPVKATRRVRLVKR